MHMGYAQQEIKTRRPLSKHPLPTKKIRVEEGEMEIGIINNEVNQIESTTELSSSVVLDDHSYCWQKDTPKCLACVDQSNLIENTGKWDQWTALENKSCFTWCKIKTDAKMNFYTGIETIEMFNVIFILIKPYFPNNVYWKALAKNRVTSAKIKKHSVTKVQRNWHKRMNSCYLQWGFVK